MSTPYFEEGLRGKILRKKTQKNTVTSIVPYFLSMGNFTFWKIYPKTTLGTDSEPRRAARDKAKTVQSCNELRQSRSQARPCALEFAGFGLLARFLSSAISEIVNYFAKRPSLLAGVLSVLRLLHWSTWRLLADGLMLMKTFIRLLLLKPRDS